MSREFSIIQEIIKKVSPEIEIEVFIVEANQIDIEVRDQQIENFNMSKKNGISLRIFHEGRVGFAYGSDISEDTIKMITKMALSNKENTTQDECNGLPEVDQDHKMKNIKIKGIYDKDLKQISVEDKIDKVKEMEKNALSYNKRIKKVLRSSYADGESLVRIVNSFGMEKSYLSTYCSVGVGAIASLDTEVQIASHGEIKRCFADLDFNRVARKAAEKAVSLLGAKRVKSQRVTVIFPPEIACGFLGIISNAFCADTVQKGKSLFKDKIGEKIGSSLITIIDDGTLPGGIATVPFDDEGISPQRKILVNKGILERYLYDTYTARKDNVQSTGNASRGSFAGLPLPSPSGFFIEKQDITRKELIEKVQCGLYIVEVMGMHMVDSVTGDFSIGVEGIWISQGAFSYPVRGVTITGNILHLLNCVEEISDDLTFYGNFGSPTLKILDVLIAGE